MGAPVAFVKAVCPRCEVKSVHHKLHAYQARAATDETGPMQFTMICTECAGVWLAELRLRHGMVLGQRMTGLDFTMKFTGDMAPHIEWVACHPTLPQPTRHAAYPAPVQEALSEAEAAYHSGGANSLTIMGLRRVLESVAGDGPGTLVQRIDALELPAALRGWAHAIRVFGNTTAHTDFRATREDAGEVMAFTRLLLEYLFVLPARVRALRARAQAAATV